MLAIVLALGTSVAYGTSNFFGPLLGRRHTVAAVLLAGALAALAVAGLIVLGSGAAPPDRGAVAVGLLAYAAHCLVQARYRRI